MDVQLFSFVLAIVVASVCFALVKITADEFDRWYDEPQVETTTAMPTVTRILGVVLALLVIFR